MKKYLIIFILSFVFFFFFISWITPCYKNGLFEVEQGQGLSQIAKNLKKQGFIQAKFPFEFYILSKGESQNLKSGVYQFTADDTFLSIAEKIIFGEAIKTKITIIEGWNLMDIGGYLENKGMFQAEELEKLYEMTELEGFLFPDTYEINPKISISEIVEKMLNNFDKKLTPELREEIQKQDKTISEIITMASLIEKEVKTKQDKELVSGIFWKRIKHKIPLNSCATIAFILGERNWTFEQMRKEIAKGKEIDSPYNTYKYLGLPIGPICNPGLDSILAAVYPENSEYWYYLSTPDGETIFSKTLDEHNLAKTKYLK